jgi:hypothetical protein
MHSSAMTRLSDPHLLLAVSLVNMADPDKAPNGMRIADNLMKSSFPSDHTELPMCLERLNGLLADPNISSGELKGLLNRASGKTWGIQYDRTFTPREFLEALRTALEEYLRRRGLR